jgi:tetratricopeptide (TPR) repeat protein
LADCGRYDEADDALQDAAASFAAARRNAEYAQAQISRGRVLAERGATGLAIAFFSELEQLGLPDRLLSQVLNNLGLLNRQAGNCADAISYLTRDAQLCAELGDNYGAGVAEYNLAGALAAAGRPREGYIHARRAGERFRAAGRYDLEREALEYASSLTATD